MQINYDFIGSMIEGLAIMVAARDVLRVYGEQKIIDRKNEIVSLLVEALYQSKKFANDITSISEHIYPALTREQNITFMKAFDNQVKKHEFHGSFNKIGHAGYLAKVYFDNKIYERINNISKRFAKFTSSLVGACTDIDNNRKKYIKFCDDNILRQELSEALMKYPQIYGQDPRLFMETKYIKSCSNIDNDLDTDIDKLLEEIKQL